MTTIILEMAELFKKIRTNPIGGPLMPHRRGLLLVPFALVCLSTLPKARAVNPPPDACYPNFTTAEGCDALNFLTTGAGNTGLGWRSLFSDSTGSFNTGVGGGTLVLNNGDSNTAIGAAALLLNTNGVENTAVGTDAMVYNDSGNDNTAVGAFALFSNTTGTYNTAIGTFALQGNTAGAVNTAIGTGALSQNTIGNNNIAVGQFAGFSLTTGDHNIDIGNQGVAGESDTIRIGSFHTSTFIAGISEQPAVGGDAVLVTASGKLGTINFSSERFKDEIKPMDKASEAILALKPVTFRYKREIDPNGIPQFGLLAEEVDKVSPDLVKRDANGKVYTVRYDAVNAMLLNEFLKEHRRFQEQNRKVEQQEVAIVQLKQNLETKVGQQAKQIEALVATVKEQAVQIQKVSAQLETSKPAAQTVVNNQ